MRFAFHPEALEEYRESALWYGQRDQRSALRFVAAVEEAIQRVVDAPMRWRVVEKMSVAALRMSFPTQSSTQSNLTLSLYWQSCIAAVNLVIGIIA